MGQMLAVPQNFGDSVVYPRKPKIPDKSIELDALSPIAHPQDAKLATERAPESSKKTIELSRNPHSRNIRLRQIERLRDPVPSPADTSLSRKTPYQKREPFSSGEEMPKSPLVRMTKVADVKPIQVGLPDMPTEIILIIAHDLPPSNLLSLSYTCRAIRHKMGMSIEHSLGKKDIKAQLPGPTFGTNLPRVFGIKRRDPKWSLPSTVLNVDHSERLELLCMLDRDRKFPPTKAVCSACADTHDRSLFSSESLAQPSHERQCLGSAGRVWICPHWILDHKLVTTSKELRGDHMCGERWVRVLAVHDEFAEPNVIWPIIVLRRNGDPPSKKLVDDILARTDVSVCKHLRFADAFISRLYSPDFKKLREAHRGTFCGCLTSERGTGVVRLAGHLHVTQGGKCESCGTRIHFSIHSGVDGTETLYLHIRRNLMGFRGCTDPAWIERVNHPEEFEELERQWQKATDEQIGTVPEE